MKSGTTYLQTLLHAQKAELAEAGVLVPGGAPGAQAAAVRSALVAAGNRTRWERLVGEIDAHRGVAVMSQEFLGPAADAAAQRVTDSFPGADIRVVVTARDLNRTLVSMWQETIQNGRSWSWEEYLAGAREAAPGATRGVRDKETPGGTFWRQQHLARMLADWSARVGAENVTLVTVPPPGAEPATLARRFAAATGLPIQPAPVGHRANESLGLASILVLRDLNAALRALGIVGAEGRALRKRFIAKTALARLAADEPRLGLEVPGWVRRQTDATLASIRSLGVEVVGDLADLTPVDVAGVQPPDVSPEHRARAALAALVETVARHPDVRDVALEGRPAEAYGG